MLFNNDLLVTWSVSHTESMGPALLPVRCPGVMKTPRSQLCKAIIRRLDDSIVTKSPNQVSVF